MNAERRKTQLQSEVVTVLGGCAQEQTEERSKPDGPPDGEEAPQGPAMHPQDLDLTPAGKPEKYVAGPKETATQTVAQSKGKGGIGEGKGSSTMRPSHVTAGKEYDMLGSSHVICPLL